MIQKIYIENFRCFDQFELDGFSRVNLFGGMNNAGKTALLEGIYLGDGSSSKNIGNVFAFRNEEKKNLSDKPVPFRSLFGDITEQIKIRTEHDGNRTTNTYYYHSHHRLKDDFAAKEQAKSEEQDFITLFSLEMFSVRGNLASAKRRYTTQNLLQEDTLYPIQYLPSSFNLLKNQVFNRFKEDERSDRTGAYLDMLRIIDNQIKEVRTQADDFQIQIKKDGYVGLHPLNYLGDAAVKVVSYTSFLQMPGIDVLLVDEIENGLHYTKQEEFWKMLFTLAKQRNVQIFATTHSLEMIKAFNKVAMENKWEEEAKYFEMYRQEDNDKIRATKRDMEELRFDLEGGYPIRG